ncbi:DUF4388 domain-containing protein [bacterium]|nr:DUF4388 domain-containing protein [bacterium]
MNNRPSSGRILFLGTPSPWAKQFLETLQESGTLSIQIEPGPPPFLGAAVPRARVWTAMLEQSPQATELLEQIRSSGKRVILIWIGRQFSKEDLFLAWQHRVHTLLESPDANDSFVVERLRHAVGLAEASERAGDILQSVKTAVLELTRTAEESPAIAELKTSVGKLERVNLQSEFLGVTPPSSDAHVPFHKSQGLSDALMTIQDLARTGRLSVKTKAGVQGFVDFIQGRPTEALCGEIKGLKAIYRMFLWENPEFHFSRHEAAETQVDDEFNASLREICLEGESFQTRYLQIRSQLPPQQIRLELEPKAVTAGMALDRAAFLTLSSIVELGKVSQVLDYNPLPDVILYESLIHLKKAGIIRVAA